MEIILAVIVGVLFACGIYLILRRSIVKLLIGLAFLSHATNLLIFTSAGLVRAEAPLISHETHQIVSASADPLPQALILTAIVISFGVLAFAVVLVHCTVQSIQTDDQDNMNTTDL